MLVDFSSFAYCSMWHIALKIPYSLLFHLSIINLSHACFARVNVRKGILCGTRGQMLPGVRLTVWSIQRQHILVVAESYSCEISQGQRRMQNAQTSVYCLSYGKGKQMCVCLCFCEGEADFFFFRDFTFFFRFLIKSHNSKYKKCLLTLDQKCGHRTGHVQPC